MTGKPDIPSLCIRDNNTSCPEPCAICGDEVRVTAPFAIHVEGGGFVCGRCASKHNPYLSWASLALEAVVAGGVELLLPPLPHEHEIEARKGPKGRLDDGIPF
jgi:hypothetical protein